MTLSGLVYKRLSVNRRRFVVVHRTEFHMFTDYVPGTTQVVNPDTIFVIKSSCP